MKLKEPVKLRFKDLANGNKSIILDIYYNGIREREYLKLYLIPDKTRKDKDKNKQTLDLANAIKSKRIVAIQNGEHGFKNSSKKSKVNLVSYVRHIAEEELKKTGIKRSNYHTLNSLANHLKAYGGEKTNLSSVDVSFIKGFILYLKTAKNSNYKPKKGEELHVLSQNTQYNLFKRFSHVIEKAFIADLISSNPFNKIDRKDIPKGEDGKREFLTIEEIKSLMNTDCKNEMVKKAFIFCCLIGFRYSDVKKLLWEDITKDVNGDPIARLRITKTKRFEDFPISQEALKWIPEYTKERETVFILPKNESVNTILKKWCEEAGITKKISFHCSRHTSATLNLSLGVPIEVVSKLLGHKKITTTQIYAKIVDESKKKAVDKQNGIFD